MSEEMDDTKQIVDSLKKLVKAAQSVSDNLEAVVKQLREQVINRMGVEKQLNDEREYFKDL
jgi:signal transduction histidine kinase